MVRCEMKRWDHQMRSDAQRVIPQPHRLTWWRLFAAKGGGVSYFGEQEVAKRRRQGFDDECRRLLLQETVDKVTGRDAGEGTQSERPLSWPHKSLATHVWRGEATTRERRTCVSGAERPSACLHAQEQEQSRS